ncbi:MAG: hypothetical protein JST08_02115 [Actinobacteria bacterium]|nr:hypothetical protein [Actinomycetota bacterium]
MALLAAVAASVVTAHTQAPKAAARASTAVLTTISTDAFRPAPGQASQDLPSPFHQGCMIGVKGTETHGCIYGDRSAKDTVVLFGDSHALMHFPALQIVAKRNGWRLEVWTKRECTPAETTILSDKGGPYSTCDTWRKRMLKRLEAERRPTTVVVAGESKTTALGSGGRALHGAANARALERGYVATLRRIRAAGDQVVMVEDTPEGPYDVADCVAADPGNPSACDFPKPHRYDREFELRAARQVRGARVIDLDSTICPHEKCRAVIGDVLVYRDAAHITADFSRTLAPRFEKVLKQVVGR